ncbi:uncharacterized protein LOC144422977 [Styela clava]
MGLLTMDQSSNRTSTQSAGRIEVGSGDGIDITTKSMHDIDDETTGSLITVEGRDTPISGSSNTGLVIGMLIGSAIVIAIIILAYRRNKALKKRSNDPYHVPIIEYKENNERVIVARSPSTAGYGTYKDLEEYPINEFSTRIEGKLTLQGLHNNI